MAFSPSSYVLLLAPHPEELQELETLLHQMRYTVEIADNAAQAMAKVSQALPCLVILQEHHLSPSIVHQIRTIDPSDRIMLVVVTDCHAPNWFDQDQNSGIDGFLVNPLSPDILSSLIHSASARQYCLNFQ